MLACLRTYGWALVSGVLMAWALPKFHFFPLAWIALVPLLLQTRLAPIRISAARFFVAGWIYHTIVLQWLVANIFWAGGWALLGQQGICLALAGYWALLGALWSRTNTLLPRWARPLAFAVCWMAMEWFQARLFTGFGWAAIGYSQGPDLWIAQWASVGGVILVSALLAASNALACDCVGDGWRGWKTGLVALLFIGGVHGAGAFLLEAPKPSATPFHVGLYQSNYAQQMKWDAEFQDVMLDLALRQSTVVTERTPVDLFVWPEALVMRDFRKQKTLTRLQDFTANTQVPLFTGSARTDRETGEGFNSSALIQPNGDFEIYDKMKLAPFGEYIPLESWLGFMQGLGAAGGTKSGDEAKVFDVGSRQMSPLICFEVLFSPMAEARRQLGADFLVVVTNLGWFGKSNILPQKFEIARFRAIETRLPVVQCANTGISGVIDPYGRIELVNGVVTPQGNFLTWREGAEPSYDDASAQRRLGVLSLPEAASPLIPGSSLWAGRLVAVLGVILLVGLFRPGAVSKTVAPS